MSCVDRQLTTIPGTLRDRPPLGIARLFHAWGVPTTAYRMLAGRSGTGWSPGPRERGGSPGLAEGWRDSPRIPSATPRVSAEHLASSHFATIPQPVR